jgi:Tol biopolymer transport system component
MPDGRSLLLNAADDKGAITAIRLDLQTNSVTPLVEETSSAAVTPDGKVLVYVANDPKLTGAGRARRLVAKDIVTGQERQLYVVPEGKRISMQYGRFEPNLQVTRDGKNVAFVVGPAAAIGGDVMVVPTAGGPARVIATSPAEWQFTNTRLIGFTPDGKQLIFTTSRNIGKPDLEEPTVWRVPLDGGPFVQLEKPGSGHRSMSVSPDGRRTAFTAGRSAEELWVMEDPRLRGTASSSPARQR